MKANLILQRFVKRSKLNKKIIIYNLNIVKV